MHPDEEEVAHEGDPILRQQEDGIARGVAGKLDQLGGTVAPVKGHVPAEGDVRRADLEDGRGVDDRLEVVIRQAAQDLACNGVVPRGDSAGNSKSMWLRKCSSLSQPHALEAATLGESARVRPRRRRGP